MWQNFSNWWWWCKSEQLYLQREKAGENQCTISLNLLSVSTITQPKAAFSSKESIIKAEILQALKTVDSKSDVLDLREEEKEFWQNWSSSFIGTIVHMMAKLPFNTFLKNCLYMHPLQHNETNVLGGISNLTLQVSNALNVLSNVFSYS